MSVGTARKLKGVPGSELNARKTPCTETPSTPVRLFVLTDSIKRVGDYILDLSNIPQPLQEEILVPSEE